MVSVIMLHYNIMGSQSYMRSVVNRNVVMQRIVVQARNRIEYLRLLAYEPPAPLPPVFGKFTSRHGLSPRVLQFSTNSCEKVKTRIETDSHVVTWESNCSWYIAFISFATVYFPPEIRTSYVAIWGTRWRSWLRHCAHKPEGRCFDCRWCHLNFSLT